MLKRHCCSTTLARKLKELGARQVSQYAWYRLPNDKDFFLRTDERPHHQNIDHYSAFTLSELGEMMPKDRQWYSGRFYNSIQCHLYSPSDSIILTFSGSSEVNARAKALCHILSERKANACTNTNHKKPRRASVSKRAVQSKS